jgi:hypothetical protein
MSANPAARQEFVFVNAGPSSEAESSHTRMVIRSLAGMRSTQRSDHHQPDSQKAKNVADNNHPAWVPYHRIRIHQGSKESRRGRKSRIKENAVKPSQSALAGGREQRLKDLMIIISSGIEGLGASSVDPFHSLPATTIPDSIISSSISFST